MAKITFYDATPMDEEQLSSGLRETDHFWQYVYEPISANNVDPDVEVVSIFVSSNLTRDIMMKMPKLRLIAARSTGFDNIDFEYVKEHGITVLNVPTYGENTVAEYAFSLILAVSRKLVPTINETALGTFQAPNHVGIDLAGRTLGIVGLGHIGQCTARIARGFGMNVVAFDVHQNEEFARENQVEYLPLEDVLSRSDIVSLHAPMVPSNYHLINEHTIALMKPGAILINTARGELVENRALIEALRSGALSGAGLDTLEGEKFLDQQHLINAITKDLVASDSYQRAAENHALLHMPNVVVTEHTAFNTVEAIRRINDTTVSNIIDFWYGKLPNEVHPVPSSGKLVIVRHSASAWNEQGRWTGTRDVHVADDGVRKAAQLGEAIKDVHFDYAYISKQKRTLETLNAMKQTMGQADIPFEASDALNERDYGVFTGMEKAAVEDAIGKEAYDELRRSWNSPIEGGESLEQVYQRTIPFYLRVIMPRLRHGQNVLIVAHGNSIRSLIKYIENVPNDKIGSVEMLHDSALSYEVDNEGHVKSRDEIAI